GPRGGGAVFSGGGPGARRGVFFPGAPAGRLLGARASGVPPPSWGEPPAGGGGGPGPGAAPRTEAGGRPPPPPTGQRGWLAPGRAIRCSRVGPPPGRGALPPRRGAHPDRPFAWAMI